MVTPPVELRHPPALWVPVRDRVRVALPYVPGNHSANPQWLREITDASQQRKCGENRQGGKPENALACECHCGGENHGGVSAVWVLRDNWAIKTSTRRRVFTV